MLRVSRRTRVSDDEKFVAPQVGMMQRVGDQANRAVRFRLDGDGVVFELDIYDQLRQLGKFLPVRKVGDTFARTCRCLLYEERNVDRGRSTFHPTKRTYQLLVIDFLRHPLTGGHQEPDCQQRAKLDPLHRLAFRPKISTPSGVDDGLTALPFIHARRLVQTGKSISFAFDARAVLGNVVSAELRKGRLGRLALAYRRDHVRQRHGTAWRDFAHVLLETSLDAAAAQVEPLAVFFDIRAAIVGEQAHRVSVADGVCPSDSG